MKDEAQALLDEEESRRASELEDMSVDFLKRYAETFDTDRKDLASAYASDASFSYCIHDIVSLNSLAAAFTNPGEVQRFAPRKGSRNLMATLLKKEQGASIDSHLTSLLFYKGLRVRMLNGPLVDYGQLSQSAINSL
ncbi:hypothetical protein EW145_g1109 [Phellinidium pouzarii]|uniref:Nuclear transport factor 2 domain-containing protein n=1 Tax=Phellinidium pouzarii TaxID=167371 RepID=A0A4S4LHI8_9AGAM|nr:hypothetical protein EW145_g1109 [Phellinidium pouzarii]